MASQKSQGTGSPSASSIFLPLGRRGSRASILTEAERESLNAALDQIHTAAYQSDTLTVFNEFTTPPTPTSAVDEKSLSGDIQGGLSGLYSRFKVSVGGVRDIVSGSGKQADKASVESSAIKSPSVDSIAKPASDLSVVAADSQQSRPNSIQESRVHSPTTGNFQSSQDGSAQFGPGKGAKLSKTASASSKSSMLPSPAIKPLTAPSTSIDREDNTLNHGSSVMCQKAYNNPYSCDGSGVPDASRSLATGNQLPEKLRKSISIDRQTIPEIDTSLSSVPRKSSQAGGTQDVNAVPQERLASNSMSSYSLEDSTAPTSATDSLARISNEGNLFHEGETPAIVATSISLTDGDANSAASSKPAAKSRPKEKSAIRISEPRLPGYLMSRASSTETTSTLPPLNTAVDRQGSRGSRSRRSQAGNDGVLSQLRSRLLSKDFWMRDENAKDCFHCGDTFSTFRRKHHCRTCGQIFDSKCTVLIPGARFGQPGSIRVCKPCEAKINAHEEDSSELSDSEQSPIVMNPRVSELSLNTHTRGPNDDDDTSSVVSQSVEHVLKTPTMAIPATRRAGEGNNRRSAVLEINPDHPLTRPTSSRSLKTSLSGRTHSIGHGHKRHHTRQQYIRNFKPYHDDRAPFQRRHPEDIGSESRLSAFHRDNIIDPDLAQYLSDDASSGDEQSNLLSAVSEASLPKSGGDNERATFGGLLAAMKKGRSAFSDRNAAGVNHSLREADEGSISSSRAVNLPRSSRRRNLSVASSIHQKQSPRGSRDSIFNAHDHPVQGVTFSTGVTSTGFKMTRSSSMKGDGAPPVELNIVSLQHVRKLLRQLLEDSAVPHAQSWETALIPILLKATDEVVPDVQHGDDMDVRHYVKLKKIPGGRPGDTSYVSGLVFTKNLALKSMPRSIPHPNILIITFPLEYARHQRHFMSLEPVIRQEREFLENLVSRIAALCPTLLLVERNVSGLALGLLEKANIATAYNVKPSVLEAVSRCTQTRIITSMDQLVTTPMHSKCGSFDVKTYVFNNRKKTYMYISGCPKSLGCTIVLRGGDKDVLVRVKRITEFMVYVVYNLKLETFLMRDEFAQIPTSSDSLLKRGSDDNSALTTAKAGDATGVVASRQNSHENTGNRTSLDLTVRTTDGVTDVPDDVPMPTYYEDMVEKHETKILSASPFVKFEPPYLLMRAREMERRLAYLKRLRDQDLNSDQSADEKAKAQKFTLITPEMVHRSPRGAPPKVKEVLHAAHDAEYERALHHYQTQKRQWEAYISGNGNLFDPYAHQNIVVLFSLVCTTTSIPCSGPDVFALEFYNEHGGDSIFEPDCTIGQYVEDLCHNANAICTANGCEKRMVEHHRQYVHGDAQISVFIQPYPCKLRGLQDVVLMWSSCKICGNETQVMPMSENTWKYSFGKYLELSFWSRNLHARAGVCPHDLQRDHLRYFGFKDVALRIHYDKINLLEIIVPRTRVTWKVDNDLRLRNEVYLRTEQRLNKFMASVKARLKGINVESVAPESLDECKKEIETLTRKANDDHAALIKLLQEKYTNSRYWELMPFNEVLRSVQEKVVEWDTAFAEFEEDFFPSEKDIKRLATLQLRRIFLDKDTSVTSLAPSEEPPTTPTEIGHDETDEAIEHPRPARRMTLSPEKAQDVLVSVVEEHSGKKNREKAQTAVELPPPLSTSEESVSPTQVRDIEEEKMPPPVLPEAVAQEEVHDVTVSSSPSDQSSLQSIPPPTSLNPSLPIAAPVNPEETAVKSPPPEKVELNEKSSKTDKVDNLEDTLPTTPPAHPPSAIPRLAENAFRRSSKPRSPPLFRTQSQPGYFQRDRNFNGPATLGLRAGFGNLHGADGGLSPPYDSKIKFSDKKLSDRFGLSSLKPTRLSSGHSLIPRSVPSKRNYSRVSSLAKHFEQLSREFEKERQRERQQRAAKGTHSRAYPMASSKPIVEVYKNVTEAVEEREPSGEGEDLLSSVPRVSLEEPTKVEKPVKGVAYEQPKEEPTPEPPMTEPVETEDTVPADSQVLSEGEADEVHSDDDRASTEELHMTDSHEEIGKMSPEDEAMDLKDLPKHERNTLLKMLTNFWSERSASGWAPLDYPLNMTDHVFADCDIIVREDEPSSLIAFALDSGDYKEKLTSIQRHFEESDERSTNHDEDTEAASEGHVERALLRPTGTHLKYQFQEGQAKMLCKVFYAEQFDALRKKCGVADRIVESLSRCAKWDSKGGKTKSLFLKTLDDRFILKSLSPIETQAFLKFAPAYFQIMSEALFHELPSAIAKMFGFFQVIIKNPATGTEFNYFLLLMENLFYDRVPTRLFDLKGSMRNRKVQSTGERNEVLLDENMVDFIYETPLFAREHSKRLLSQSVWNDTLFLGRQNVMDYSLMIAIDEIRQELVVGIIDCIRTYTWDKKLESWIKDRGLAGGGKNRPTVTSPKEYKSRFREAMARYVLQAPR